MVERDSLLDPHLKRLGSMLLYQWSGNHLTAPPGNHTRNPRPPDHRQIHLDHDHAMNRGTGLAAEAMTTVHMPSVK